MAAFDPEHIRKAIDELKRADPRFEVFGASSHKYELHPAITQDRLIQFEEKHKIRLPDDYRFYLMELGNGGAGPYYGVFQLGEMDNGFEFAQWKQGNGFVGILAKPFPHTESWNDLEGKPGEEMANDENAYDAAIEAFDEKYWNSDLVNGAIPICHQGCAIRTWLVITGPEAGNIWVDNRTSNEGLSPDSDNKQSRYSFGDWYRRWLQRSLFEVRRR